MAQRGFGAGGFGADYDDDDDADPYAQVGLRSKELDRLLRQC